MNRYESAKEIYAALGVDTDAAIQKLKTVPVALHCWQGDDVIGFDHDGPLTGGIQTTGHVPLSRQEKAEPSRLLRRL